MKVKTSTPPVRIFFGFFGIAPIRKWIQAGSQAKFRIMENVDQQLVNDFIEACHLAGRLGLVRCSSGNLSLRVGPDTALVTASRSWLQDLREDQIALCQISTGELLCGGPASVESRFHLGILHARREIACVFHFQSPAATTFACIPDVTDFNIVPEVPFYIGPIARVPFLLPGTAPLADAVVAAMRDHDLAILQNHGLVTVGTTLRHAIQNAEFFELACDLMLRAGDRAVMLTPDAVRTLREPHAGA